MVFLMVQGLLLWIGGPLMERGGGSREGMVDVPGGDIVIRPPGSKREERYRLEAFCIDKYPVTVAQFRTFLHAIGRVAEPMCNAADTKLLRDGTVRAAPDTVATPPDSPVVGIRYDWAAAYAAWVGKRLPTEAEWEMAARGPTERRYPWGDVWHDANVALARGIAPVGHHAQGASPFGAEDMVGNVFHWTCSEAAGLASSTGFAFKGRLRLVKGGAWPAMREWNECRFRTAFSEQDTPSVIGLRCVLPASRTDPNLAADAAVGPRSCQDEAAGPGFSEALRQAMDCTLQRPLSPAARDFLNAMPAGACVGDIGAGSGILTWPLSDRVGPRGRVLAVDIDASVAAFLRNVARAEKRTNVEVIQSVRNDTRLPRQSCDALLLCGVLSLVAREDLDGFVTSCCHAMKPGSRMLVVTNRGMSDEALRRFQQAGLLLLTPMDQSTLILRKPPVRPLAL